MTRRRKRNPRLRDAGDRSERPGHTFGQQGPQIDSGDVERFVRSESILADLVAKAWQNNWWPVELVLATQRTCGQIEASVVAIAIRIERGMNPRPVSHFWLDELDRAAEQCDERNFHALMLSGDHDSGAILDATTEASLFLMALPSMTRIDPGVGPVSGQAAKSNESESGPSKKLLQKVRALLAKAEGTEFPDEADAFTAKAHQLMSEHSIEHAMLDDPAQSAPATIRIWHDRPYVKSKSYLLSAVAHGAGGRTVFHSEFGVTTVFGFANDLESIELLFTSLLVQASSEMQRLEREFDIDRKRVKSFRNSFFIGFGNRIRQRLTEVRSQATERAAGDDPEVLPVLASRGAEVDQAVDEAFGPLSSMRSSASNSAGFSAGTVAADRANIGPGSDQVGRRAS
ncbi:MAG: DUF2786 domain-containing protein [Actinobacteria bacterium]|nr:DUF2786 domain-containing protein [Actinomycetota bacterium]